MFYLGTETSLTVLDQKTFSPLTVKGGPQRNVPLFK